VPRQTEVNKKSHNIRGPKQVIYILEVCDQDCACFHCSSYLSRFAVLLISIFHMQPGNQEFVDSFCSFVRGNPTYADGYGRWFPNPLLVQSKALDLVHKLHWQQAEGASMWDHYLLQHYVPDYLMPLFDLASSVWEARHWLMSTNLKKLNFVPVYRTQMNMETEFRRVVRKFARWRRQFYERTYPHTGDRVVGTVSGTCA
jgi:hypothetical protein